MRQPNPNAQVRRRLRPAAAGAGRSELRVVGRLQKRGTSWLLLSGDLEIHIRPRWRTRGALLNRQLLWYLRSSDDVYDAIPAPEQPTRLLKAQPDGRFPSGLRAAAAKSHAAVPRGQKLRRTGGTRSSGSPQLAARRIDLGRVPARGPRFVRGGLPGLGRRR